MKNHITCLLAFLFVFIVSCQKEDNLRPSLKNNSNFAELEQRKSANSVTFLVRIENVISSGFVTPFAPGIWMIQKKNSHPLFSEGQSDFGQGLEALAEDGDPSGLYHSLEHHPKVRSRGIFNTPQGSSGPGPIFPGDAYEFLVSAKPNDYLNFATMFIQSNDLFVGPSSQGIALFDNHKNPIGGDITAYMELWDAGTEINEEPGVGPNQAPRQSGPNTGPDENGVVQIVNDGYSYPQVSDMLRITVTPQ